jgi:hypothetical protein
LNLELFYSTHGARKLCRSTSMIIGFRQSCVGANQISATLNSRRKFRTIGPRRAPVLMHLHRTRPVVQLISLYAGRTAIRFGWDRCSTTPRRSRTPIASKRGGRRGFSFSNEEARANRRLLYWLMVDAGFASNPSEWWHFSFGDQMWAKLRNEPEALYAGTEAQT